MSTAAVASSMMITLLLRNNARAIANSCRCPAEKLCPPELTSVSSVTLSRPFEFPSTRVAVLSLLILAVSPADVPTPR